MRAQKRSDHVLLNMQMRRYGPPLFVAALCLIDVVLCQASSYENEIARALCKMGSTHRRMSMVFGVLQQRISKTDDTINGLETDLWKLKKAGLPDEKYQEVNDKVINVTGSVSLVTNAVKVAQKKLEEFIEKVKTEHYNDHYLKLEDRKFGESVSNCRDWATYNEETPDKLRKKLESGLKTLEAWATEESNEWEKEQKEVESDLLSKENRNSLQYGTLHTAFKDLVKSMMVELTTVSFYMPKALEGVPGADAAVNEARKFVVVAMANECQSVASEAAASEEKQAQCEKLNKKLQEIKEKKRQAIGGDSEGPKSSDAKSTDATPTSSASQKVIVEEVLDSADGDELMELVQTADKPSAANNSKLSPTNLALAISIPVALVLIGAAVFLVMRRRTAEKVVPTI
ncbi:hypothetical protein, conserved in T. vivax [Trypanosoma vivax Y486]|uniref:65 kDa invariant surface glycoprotein n=1 Tax=Trypanosoma vivax (strain Y486) TaxID=1055687 RepID=F9WVM3_TRYVY|nr:hypothetical protein, conserved in T. vivax [Trypanosoma vivax Y486]|eukprot:CCD21631.1 hypothetical protein, conserved in T. vivax [Trypanosoma vivax Y486]